MKLRPAGVFEGFRARSLSVLAAATRSARVNAKEGVREKRPGNENATVP